MAHCTSSPTRTSTGVGTTQSVSTSVSRYVTTPPGSVFTTFVGSCSTVSNSTICGTSTRVVTQPGTPFTTEGQVVVTVNVPYSYTTTLYGSSCTTTPGDVYSVPSASHTPVVSTITSSSVYTSDGSTYITVVTSVSSADPAQSTSTSPGESSSSNSSNNNNLPVIIGGTLGGISALALLAIVAWKFLKKPRISFDQEDYTSFNDSTKQDHGTTPYPYKPVAQQDTQMPAKTFANDTRLQPAGYGNDVPAFNNGVAGGDTLTQYTGATSNGVGATTVVNETGLQPGLVGNDVMYNLPNHGPVHQMPVPSPTPLVAGAAAVAAGRPNSTLSSTAYMPGSDATGQINYAPNMGYAPQQYPSYPSALAPYPQQRQSYVPSPVQGQGQRPLSHNFSVGSTMTMSTSSGFSPSPNMSPLVVQPGQTYPQPQPQQTFAHQSYEDSTSGSQSVGSVGGLGNQVFQVSNPGPDTLAQDSSTAYGTSVVGPSSSTPSPPSLDGKGRPLDIRGEKVPIVHLDGGAYGGESSNSAPPAYRE